MANSIKIGNLDISAFKVGVSDCSIYLGNVKLYPSDIPPTPPTPTGSTCYEIISTPITSYTSTTYDSVYSFSDFKWYMKNNLSQYEEYGIYDVVNDIASATTYEGKIGVVGTTEYQYSGGSWSIVGSYVDSSVTYTIDDTDPSPYVGQELSTTFKIPYSDVESIGWVNLYIRDNNDGELKITLDDIGTADYYYEGDDLYFGEVTEDGEYFYLSLPSEAPQSIVIDGIEYWESTPIHLIVGSKQITVEYEEKDIPLGKTYSSVVEMELDTCPTVGINQYGVVGNDVYQFNDMEEWDTISSYKFIGKYGNIANVVECNSSSVLTSNEISPNYISSGLTSGIIGSCVTSVGENAFQGSSIISIEIPNSVTNIGNGAFIRCSSLTSCTIPSGVTSIGANTFYYCTSFSSATIPNSVTSIGSGAFQYAGLVNLYIPSSVTSICANTFTSCSKLESIIVDSSNSVYDSRNNCNALIKTSTNELVIGCKNTVIPNGITTIGNAAFINCTGLTGDFVIPNSVTSIDSNAFRPCTGLRSITIGTGISNIGMYAFYGCSSLTSITINRTTPPTLANDSVFTNTNNCTIYVPSASVNTYKSATNWSTYASRIQAIPS